VNLKYCSKKTYWTGNHPSEKYFKNAQQFKSSPQNNGISAALLKQRLCGSGMYDEYIHKPIKQ
jgi:hypothetical protein